ncbi:hypothetical protein D3C87_1792350 [compost metagenome]
MDRNPAERRDQDAEKCDRGDRLDRVQDAEQAVAQARDAMAENAERNADNRCGRERPQGEHHVLAGLGPEGVGTAGILLE